MEAGREKIRWSVNFCACAPTPKSQFYSVCKVLCVFVLPEMVSTSASTSPCRCLFCRHPYFVLSSNWLCKNSPHWPFLLRHRLPMDQRMMIWKAMASFLLRASSHLFI